MMVRTQIQLTEEQAEALRAMAQGSGVSIAEVVRQAVDELLADVATGAGDEVRARALAVIGRFESGEADVAEQHDRWLAEAFRH